MSDQKKIEGYWFGNADADGVVRLDYGDGRVVRVGETLEVTGAPVLCEWGLHASRRVIDALRYAHGPILACVRLSGKIVEGNDKLVATARETVWLGDVSVTLQHFACDVAERTLQAERDAGREPDPSSWEAIAVKRRWLAGEATDAELSEARVAAWDAVEGVAWDAVEGVAWAAVEGVAWAAEEAAWAAARAVAWTAARAAARAAAEEAAWAAACTKDQERAWQEAHLRDLLLEANVPIW